MPARNMMPAAQRLAAEWSAERHWPCTHGALCGDAPAFHDRLAGAIHCPAMPSCVRTATPPNRARGAGEVGDSVDVQDGARRAGARRRVSVLLRGERCWRRAGRPRWARQLDLRVPIQPGKGYSLTWSRPARCSARWC
jgi:D-amino-acid dehydrogenase